MAEESENESRVELENSLRLYLEEVTAQPAIVGVEVRGKVHRMHGEHVINSLDGVLYYEEKTGKKFDDQDISGAQALLELNNSVGTTINTVISPTVTSMNNKVNKLEKTYAEILAALKNTAIAKAIGAKGTTFTAVNDEISSIVNRGSLTFNSSSSTSKTISPGYYSGGTLSSSSAYSSGYNSGYSSGYSSGRSQRQYEIEMSRQYKLSFTLSTGISYSGKSSTWSFLIDRSGSCSKLSGSNVSSSVDVGSAWAKISDYYLSGSGSTVYFYYKISCGQTDNSSGQVYGGSKSKTTGYGYITCYLNSSPSCDHTKNVSSGDPNGKVSNPKVTIY